MPLSPDASSPPLPVGGLRHAQPDAFGCPVDLIALRRRHVRIESILIGPFAQHQYIIIVKNVSLHLE